MSSKYRFSPPPEIISYAQNREDIYIAVILHTIKEGTYIDIGANDPVTDSVTKYFYDKGWSGINIEPNSVLAARLRKQRSRDTTLQVLVGEKSGSTKFRRYQGKYHGLSTSSEEMKTHMQDSDAPYIDEEVATRTLSDILSEYPDAADVDFMKIDVEGSEYPVLAGNDWKRYRPKLLIIESNHIEQDWHPIIEAAKYTKVFFDGLNEYYVSEEYLPEVDFSVYPSMVLEGTPIVSWQEVIRRTAVFDKYEQALADCESAGRPEQPQATQANNHERKI